MLIPQTPVYSLFIIEPSSPSFPPFLLFFVPFPPSFRLVFIGKLFAFLCVVLCFSGLLASDLMRYFFYKLLGMVPRKTLFGLYFIFLGAQNMTPIKASRGIPSRGIHSLQSPQSCVLKVAKTTRFKKKYLKNLAFEKLKSRGNFKRIGNFLRIIYPVKNKS